MADEAIKLMICVDCLMFAANAEVPEDPVHADQIARGFGRQFDEGYIIAAGDSENDWAYSTEWCPVCDSTLFGSRHEAWAIPRKSPGT